MARRVRTQVSLLLLFLLTFATAAEAQPPAPGTIKIPLLTQAAGSALGMIAMGNMKEAEKEKIQHDLKEGREKYWAAYPSGRGLEQAQNAYAEALFAKDRYMLEIYITDMIALQFKGRNGPNVAGLLHGFENATGYIEPIHLLARPLFEKWGDAQMAANLGTKDQQSAFRQAFPEFQKYAAFRDILEYIFANPKSPLLQDSDPVAYLAALLFGSGLENSWERAWTHAAKFDTPATHEALHQTAMVIRSYQNIDDFRVKISIAAGFDTFVEHLISIKSGGPQTPPPAQQFYDPATFTLAARLALGNQTTASLKLAPPANGAVWKDSVGAVMDRINQLVSASQADLNEAEAAQAVSLATDLLSRLQRERADSLLTSSVELELLPLKSNQMVIASDAMWTGKMHVTPPAVTPQSQAPGNAPGAVPSVRPVDRLATATQPLRAPVAQAASVPTRSTATPVPSPAVSATTLLDRPPAPSASSAPAAPLSSALAQLQGRYDALSSRAAQDKIALTEFAARMAANKMTMRHDIEGDRDRLNDLLNVALEAIRAGDEDKAAENLRYVEGTIANIEKFLGR